MKLLLCNDCRDVFKLVKYGERSCLCGKVKGKLTGRRSAIVNGKGVSLTLDNVTLDEAIKKLEHMDQNQAEGYYKMNTKVDLYVCPHKGYGNPRTNVVNTFDETSETETLTPDKIAYRESLDTQGH